MFQAICGRLVLMEKKCETICRNNVQRAARESETKCYSAHNRVGQSAHIQLKASDHDLIRFGRAIAYQLPLFLSF